MFAHPASRSRSYGVFSDMGLFHVLPNGDVWAYTSPDKSYAVIVYSAKLGRQVLVSDGYPIVTGGKMARMVADTVQSYTHAEEAKEKADALFAPAPAATAEAFLPASADQMLEAEAEAEAGAAAPSILGVELTPGNLAIATLAALGAVSIFRRSAA